MSIQPSEDAPPRNVHSDRAILFAVVVWGEAFIERLCSLTVRSLLAERNLPILKGHPRATFMVCAPRAEWPLLQERAEIRMLSAVIEVEYADLPDADGDKYRRMSKGHTHIAQAAVERGAVAVPLCPDTVLTNGFVEYLLAQINSGMKVLMVGTLRYVEEPVVAALTAEGYMDPTAPLSISPRDMARIASARIHPESRRFEWGSPHYSHTPINTYWPAEDGDGFILHALGWGPLAVDYGGLDAHDASTLEHWTMDGDYAFKNFGADDPGIRFSLDSDDFIYLSVTPQAEMIEPLVRNWTPSASLRTAYFDPKYDDLKRRLFWLPVFVHAGDVTDAWRRAEDAIQDTLRNVIRPPRRIEKLWCHYYREGVPGLLEHARDWLNVRLSRSSRD